MFTVTGVLSPAVPLNEGVGLGLRAASGFRVTEGAVVSTTNLTGALAPTLRALSVCTACAVYVPSGSVAEAAPELHCPATGAAPVAFATGVPDAASPA